MLPHGPFGLCFDQLHAGSGGNGAGVLMHSCVGGMQARGRGGEGLFSHDSCLARLIHTLLTPFLSLEWQYLILSKQNVCFLRK